MEWFDVNVRRPRNGREVLVLRKCGEMRTAKTAQAWSGGFKIDIGGAEIALSDVTHWAAKPAMPNAVGKPTPLVGGRP
jgi:hypothetical protein